jgi:hypothetical protein
MPLEGGPNIGAEQTLGGIAGGLGNLLQGYMAGRQERLQEGELKEQTAERKAALANQIADNYRAQLRSRPDLAQDPNYTNILTKASKQYGFDLPMTNGQLDVDAFAPRPTLAGSIPPDKLDAWYNLTPEQRTAYAKANGLDTRGAEDMLTAKQSVSKGDSAGALRAVSQQLQELEAGNATLPQVDAALRLWAPYLPGLNMDDIVEANPQLMTKLSAGASAKIDNLVAHGLLSRAEAQKAKADANTLAGLRKVQEQHLQSLDADRLLDIQRKIKKDADDLAVHQRNADLAAARIAATYSGQQVEMRGQDLRYAAEIRGQDLRAATTKVDTTAERDVKEMREYVGTVQKEKDSLYAEAKDLVANHKDVPKEMTDRIDFLDGQLTQYDKALKDAEKALPQIKEQAVDHKLESAGVKGLDATKVKAPATDPKFQNYLQGTIQSLSAFPKATRVQVFMSSPSGQKWYTSLPGPERVKVIQAIQAAP